ncbi:MatE family protein [Leishmania donovani]|uniref:MatE family protein n=1 Tax=Leishmania donovani TaxID=5661 RepID=A0A504XKD1_LEIDO|nr:MatE family protein [Leishmania donovani]
MSTQSYADSENDVVIDNLSFASHISTSGRCAPADVESIAQAIASTSRRPEDGAPSTNDGEEAGLGMTEDISTMDIVKKFFFVGYPLTLSSLAQFSLNLIIIMVIGRLLGLEAMGGVSLALGLVNATGFAFGAGLCGALETVLSHTFGHFQQEENKRLAQAKTEAERTGTAVEPQVSCTLHMYGIYAQRMSIILMVASVPLGFVLCFADALLTIAGESAAFIFVKLFGFAGSPIAWLIMMTGVVAGLVYYLRYTGRDKLTWGGWDIRCAQNLNSLVKIALPSMGMMLSEWVALEVNALAGGYGTAAELGAYTITLQVFGIMWAMGSGVMILTSVFVGNAIGEGKPLLARRIAFIALAVVLGIATVDVVLCLFLQPFIPSFFVQTEEVDAVAAIYRELMYVVMPYHFVDVFQSTVMGALRGCELQKLGAVIITVAFCAVGVPLSFLLFFYFKIGIRALWIGPFTGVAVVGTPAYIYILLRYIKWENLKPHVDNAAKLGETKTGDVRTRAISNPAEVPLDNAVASVESPQVVAVRRFVNSPTPITIVQVPTAASIAEKSQQESRHSCMPS